MTAARAPTVAGRYAIYGEIATGGMAAVHWARLHGPVGFSRTVAIKRLHPQFAKDPEFVAGFLDEARLAARVRHPNVVSVHDVVAMSGELFLVMDYVQGETLARLLYRARQQRTRVTPAIAVSIVTGVLHGLQAAHDAVDEGGAPLELVHRDVSPQNILVGVDGIARVVDFGIAKAAGRAMVTREGQIKGKVPYMAPEQLRGAVVTRRTDVYAASVVLWESIVGERLFTGESDAAVFGKVLEDPVSPPSLLVRELPEALDAIVLRGLERRAEDRFESARAMALALEACVRPATPTEVGAWVERTAHEVLAERARHVAEIEGGAPPERELVTQNRAPISLVDRLPSGATPTFRSRRRPVIVGAIAVGCVALAAVVWASTRKEPAPVPQPTPVAPASSAPASTSAPAASPVPTPTSPGVTPSATTSAPAPTGKPPPSKSKPTVKPGPKPPGPNAGCYTLDKLGIWHIKPECL